MEFDDSSISSLIQDINKEYYIPVFQRQITWDREQMIDLFDSLMKDYYIGELLFWHPSYSDSSEVPCYKFIKNYIPDNRAPKESLDGRFRNNITELEIEDSQDLTFVLDGQQRLNTLFIGLKGHMWKREKGAEYAKQSSWEKTELYIDLMNDSDENSYKFEFISDPDNKNNKQNEYWYKVSEILDVDNLNKEIDRVKNQISSIKMGLDEEHIWDIEANMERLYDTFVREKNISFYSLDDDLPSNEAHKVFIRTNESGTQLSRTDLEITKMTPIWDDVNNQIPREEFIKTMDEVNSILNKKKFEVDKIVKLFYICTGDKGWTRAKNNRNYTELSNIWSEKIFQKTLKQWCNIMSNSYINPNSYTQKSSWPTIYYLYKANLQNSAIDDEFKQDLIFLANILTLCNGKRDTMIQLLSQIDDFSTIRFDKIESEMEGRPFSLYLDKEPNIENFKNWRRIYGSDKARVISYILSDTKGVNENKYILKTDGKQKNSEYYSLANMYFDDEEAKPLIQGKHLYDEVEMLDKNAERLIDRINNIIDEKIESSK